MTRPERPQSGLRHLRAEQQAFVRRFLERGRGHALLSAPPGMGKTAAATEIAAAVVEQGGTVLLVMRGALGEQFKSRVPARVASVTGALTKAALRQLSSESAEFERAAMHYVAPQLTTDAWAASVLHSMPWDLVVLDDPDPHVLQAVQGIVDGSGARLLILANPGRGASYVQSLPHVEVTRLHSPFLLPESAPGDLLARSFEPVWWERPPREVQIVRSAETLATWVCELGLEERSHRLTIAAASSNHALQVETLALIDELRVERDVAAHLPGGAASAVDRDARSDVRVLETFAHLERLARQIDQLSGDPKFEALKSTAAEHAGDCVIFCALPTTADYVATSLTDCGYAVASIRPRTEETSTQRDPDRRPDVIIVSDRALHAADLHPYRTAVNYDLASDAHRIQLRWSRLDWMQPRSLHVHTLLPRTNLSDFERRSLDRAPYLVGDPPRAPVS